MDIIVYGRTERMLLMDICGVLVDYYKKGMNSIFLSFIDCSTQTVIGVK